MTEALTDQDREDLLRSVGYTPDVDQPAPVAETPVPTPPKRRKKTDPEPALVTATSPLYDNAWQDTQFQARKAIVGKGYDKDEAAAHNKALWKALGDERMTHNKGVRQAQRDLSGTGTLKDVITAQRDHREAVEDLVRNASRKDLEEALRRLE